MTKTKNKERMKTVLDSLSTTDGREIRVTIKATHSHNQWTFEKQEKLQKLIEKIEEIVKTL